MKTRRLLQLLGSYFPKKAPGDFKDFLGLQVGPLKSEVLKIILALDLDENAIELALKEGATMIITHHPLLFPNKKIAFLNSLTKQRYETCIKNKLTVYSYHSNFDVSSKGMNFSILKELGCDSITAFSNGNAGAFGHLPYPMSLAEFSEYVASKLNLPYVQLFESPKGTKEVHTIGLCAGSGSNEYLDAMKAGVEVYLSGDSRHHHRLSMYWEGMHFIEIPHEAEVFFTTQMNYILNQIDPSLEVFQSPGTPYAKVIMVSK